MLHSFPGANRAKAMNDGKHIFLFLALTLKKNGQIQGEEDENYNCGGMCASI